MKIAVIGTGNVGAALGGTFARAGHDVTLAAQDAEKTKRVAEQVGARAAADPAEAAENAEIVVLAIPFGALEEVGREIADAGADKVVVDATNPIAPDYSGLADPGGPSAAERLADVAPRAKVAKAFNTLFASLQGDPEGLGERLDALFATDDDGARSTLTDLLASLGFRPIDAGPLENARLMEALAWLNMSLQMRTNGDWRSSFVLLGAPAGAVREPQSSGARSA